jgi:hypothetical protein
MMKNIEVIKNKHSSSVLVNVNKNFIEKDEIGVNVEHNRGFNYRNILRHRFCHDAELHLSIGAL